MVGGPDDQPFSKKPEAAMASPASQAASSAHSLGVVIVKPARCWVPYVAVPMKLCTGGRVGSKGRPSMTWTITVHVPALGDSTTS